jgi:hypothetical protein
MLNSYLCQSLSMLYVCMHICMYVSVWQQPTGQRRAENSNAKFTCIRVHRFILFNIVYVEKWTTGNRRWISNGIHEDTSVNDPEL